MNDHPVRVCGNIRRITVLSILRRSSLILIDFIWSRHWAVMRATFYKLQRMCDYGITYRNRGGAESRLGIPEISYRLAERPSKQTTPANTTIPKKYYEWLGSSLSLGVFYLFFSLVVSVWGVVRHLSDISEG